MQHNAGAECRTMQDSVGGEARKMQGKGERAVSTGAQSRLTGKRPAPGFSPPLNAWVVIGP